MGIFNYNRHFFKHVLKGDVSLFQSAKHVKNTLVWWSEVSGKVIISFSLITGPLQDFCLSH